MDEEKKQPDFPEENFEEFASEVNDNLDMIKASTDRFFKRRLIMFCVRWTLTLGLLYFFMDSYPWIKYLVYAAIPLGLINLILIFVGRKKINEKLSETEDKINSI